MANDLKTDLKTFSIQEARRIALTAQGFADPRPAPDTVTFKDFDRVMKTVNIVQIDTINVLIRTQYMPFFSRLGPYPQDMLHKYAYEDRNLFEYYAHAAALTPMSQVPLLRHRMAEWKPWRRWTEIMAESPGLLESIAEEIQAQGPMEVADFDFKGDRYGYWGTSTTKLVLETLMFQGQFTVSDRLNSARRYDLIERVVPQNILKTEIPRDEARQKMMKLAISSLGIATDYDLADYYRIRRAEAQAPIKSLLERGEIERVKVEGIEPPTYALANTEPPSTSSQRPRHRLPVRLRRLVPQPTRMALRLLLQDRNLRPTQKATLRLLRNALHPRRPLRSTRRPQSRPPKIRPPRPRRIPRTKHRPRRNRPPSSIRTPTPSQLAKPRPHSNRPQRQPNPSPPLRSQKPLILPSPLRETIAKLRHSGTSTSFRRKPESTVPFRGERGREQAKRARRGMQVGTRGQMDSTQSPAFCNSLLRGRGPG